MGTDDARPRPVERANGAGQHCAKGPLRYTDEQIYRSDRSFLLTFAGAGALAITLLLIASGALADWVAVALITACGAIATIGWNNAERALESDTTDPQCGTTNAASRRRSGSTPSPGASDSVTQPSSMSKGNTSSRNGLGLASTSA